MARRPPRTRASSAEKGSDPKSTCNERRIPFSSVSKVPVKSMPRHENVKRNGALIARRSRAV